MGSNFSTIRPPQVESLLEKDGYLRSYESEIVRRYSVFRSTLERLETECGGLDDFTRSYERYGIHKRGDNSIECLEWAPGADALFLMGDFNNWSRDSHPYTKGEYGQWRMRISANGDGTCPIQHGCRLKVLVHRHGAQHDRLSPWAQYVTCGENSNVYEMKFYSPEKLYKPTHPHPSRPRALRIYEAHVGISSSEPRIANYREFADDVVPRIVKQGYNTIQLMAVMEHAYYACFGYQVTSFFAASSRFGTPCDLAYLVDRAHAAGLVVLLDVVHSHASKNTADGLNEWDGSAGAYFHDNARGYHTLWDSRLFNYTEVETLRFLLSNLRFWVERYGFDGFRFDGVTSMLYHSHGMGEGFTGHYDEYFGLNTDTESLNYLMLANHMLHTFYPFMTTIAEDVSGMPGLCRPIEEGGGGFDYRLAMGIPDMWIKLLKTTKDEDWNITTIVHTLENRRWSERHVAYAESHDQALVGDKTIAFWLMDKEMYDFMSTQTPLTAIIERGIALHKLIRAITHGLGGEAWLNFEGNEFGHPEWLDFPRAGNNSSYHYARRQWNLPDNELLRYKWLNEWDRALNEAEERYRWLTETHAFTTYKHQGDMTASFERRNAEYSIVFIFNFHTSKSFSDYKIPIRESGTFDLVLCSDDEKFGGHARIAAGQKFQAFNEGYSGQPHHICVYIPSRVCLILVKKC